MHLLEFIQVMLCKIETISITVVVKFVVNGRCYLKQDLADFPNTSAKTYQNFRRSKTNNSPYWSVNTY